MKKIAFVCDFWNNAGTEIAAISWLNILAQEYEVTLYLLEDKINVRQKLDKQIKIKQNFWYSNYYGRVLCLTHWKLTSFWGVHKFRALIWNQIFKDGDYAAILNFPDSSATFFKYLHFKKTKLIAWNHFNYGENVAFAHGNLAQLKNKYYNGYINSDVVVSVSQASTKNFNQFFASFGTNFNVKCLYTPLDATKIIKKSCQKQQQVFQPGFNILNLARIDSLQKGQLRLLKVIAKINLKYQNINFYFIGDANEVELKKFQDLKTQLKLTNVFYLGKQNNPYPALKACDLFIFPSYFEGFGLVVEEALILHKPVVVTNMTSAEILQNQKYGNVCANSTDGIYHELAKILADKSYYERLQNKANLYQPNNQKILAQFKKII